jgi:ribosomal-protein-alanine N-acetyltransferase
MAASRQIETERLILRRPRLSDAKALQAAFGDPEVMQFIGDGATMTPAKTRAWLEKALARWKADGFGHFAVERKEDKKVIGRVGFLVWDPDEWKTGTLKDLGDHGVVELGWLIAREYWGNGYATEAALECRNYAFKELRLERLIHLIAYGNEASVRVAEKIGARYVREIGRGDWKARLYASQR